MSNGSVPPLTTTTTTHALVLMVYVSMIVNGVLYAAGLAQRTALTGLLGDRLTVVWAVLVVVGGVVGLSGAVLAPRYPVPVAALWIEAAGCMVMAMAGGVYAWAVMDMYGAPNGSVIIVAFTSFGFIARIVQICIDQKHIQRAMRRPRLATPAPLAEAPINDGG